MRWIIVLFWLGGAVAVAQDTKENADFKLAVSLYNDGLYDLAAEQLQQFISTFPNTQQGIEARMYLGLTQARLKKYEDARFTFQNFALSFPDHPRAAEAWFRAAEAYVELGNPAEAALAFERVKTFHARSPLAPNALLQAGRYFIEAGNPEQAAKVLRALTQEYASADVLPEAHERLAELYFAGRQYERAAAEARRSVDLRPRPAAFQTLARALAQLGRFDEAARVLSDVVSQSRNDTVSHSALLELGRIQRDAGDPSAAVATWAGILGAPKAAPGLKQAAAIETGDLQEVSGRIRESMTQFERAALTGGARTGEAFYKASRAAERLGDTAKAAAFAIKALEADSGSAFSRGILLSAVRGAIALGQAQQSSRLAQRFGNEYPDDPLLPRLLLRLGEFQMRSNDPRQAQRTFEQVLSEHEGDPVEDDAWYGLARALRAAGMPREALSALETLRTKFPASDDASDAARLALEISLFELKDKEGGVENLALLVGDVIAGGAKGELAFRLAEISFNDLKDYPNAARHYRSALEGGLPGNLKATAWLRLGRALEYSAWGQRKKTTDIQSIAAAYDSVMALAPGSPEAREAFEARTLLLLSNASTVDDVRRVSGGVRASREAAQGIPPAIVLELARAYRARGAAGDAVVILGDLLRSRLDPDTRAEALFLLAGCQLERGRQDSVATVLDGYLKDYPAHRHAARAIVMLAEIESRRGRVERVMELCRTVERDFSYTSAATEVDRIRGDAAYAAGDIPEALRRYRSVLTAIREDLLTPRTPSLDLLLKLADCSRRTGSRGEARLLYASALAADTASVAKGQVLRALAEIAREENNFEAAARYLQEASRTGSSEPAKQFQAALESANLLFEAEEYATAATRYQELEPKAPADSIRRFLQARLVLCAFRTDNSAEAERLAGAFVKSHPAARADAASFEYERGRRHLRRNEMDLALRRFENIRQRFGDTPIAREAVYWLARTYEQRNDAQRAIQLYDSLVAAFPSDPIVPRARLSLGNVYYALEQWDAAARNYRLVVEAPDSPPDLVQFATSNLIMAYKEIGLFDAALQLTRTYIANYPDDPDLILKQIDIGVIYQKLGYNDQSILHLQKLLETADKELEGELRYYIAEAYFNKGEYQQAILEFLKVPYLITRPTKVDWIATSYYMAGQAYEKMSKFDQAITMYRQIIDRAGIDPTFKAAAQKEIDRVNTVVNQK